MIFAPNREGFVLFLLAGLAGASAMILPGLSGGYLLLLLGQYVPILDGISRFKNALSERDFAALVEVGWAVVLPVGIGVVAGVVLVSNLLKWLLQHHRSMILGVLMGLLLGSVVGLWPFQEAVEPIIDVTVIKGQLVTEQNFGDFEPKDWPTRYFSPNVWQVLGSVVLVAFGFLVTLGVAFVGQGSDEKP